MEILDGKNNEFEEIVGDVQVKEIHVIGFKLKDELVGVPIEEIIEITTDKDITPVPKSPSYVLGVMNLRGKIVPVTTVKEILGVDVGESEEIYKKNNIIILETKYGEVGVVVDEIVGSLRFPEDDMLPEPTGTIGIESKYIKGVVQLEEGLLIVLNVSTLFNKEEE